MKDFSVQNLIKLRYLTFTACFISLIGCQEDTVEADLSESDTLRMIVDIPAPIMRLVESKVHTTLKFGFSVTAEQVQDTVYYLVLPDSVAAPSANDLLNHSGITELPMQGSYFRSTFQADLSPQTKYVVYAVIRKGKHRSELSNLALTTGQEMPPPPTNPQDTTAAPVLEARGIPQNDLISLAVLVNGDQIEGTLHYLYFTENKNPGMPTPQELVDHRLTQTVSMKGATIKKFNFPATSKTKYHIYGVLQVGNKLSRVVLIERATV